MCLISRAVITQNKTPLHIRASEQEPPSPAPCESLIMRSVKTEAVTAGVGNLLTKKLLEELCVAQCQITPLCFIK